MKILVIEDDEQITRIIKLYLEQAGYDVRTAADGITGLELHARELPALVILDLMLPSLDGMEVCRRIRSWSQTPILMLTARQSEEDRITGLESGADDYLVKPFSPRELVSRVKAILRRVQPQQGEKPVSHDELTYGMLSINLPGRRVRVNQREIALTAKEYDLLLVMAQAPDRVFTREALLEQVWGYSYLGDGRTVDVHVGTLRKKLEQQAGAPHHIQTVWGVGYKFVP